MRRTTIPVDCVAEVGLATCSKSCSCDEDVVTVDAVLAVDVVEVNVGVVQKPVTMVIIRFVSPTVELF